METVIKTFDELSVYELYELLRLRADVFVVEQRCPFGEIDGADPAALHVFLRDEGGIEAYLRILPAEVTGDNVRIGRVVARRRSCGLGAAVLDAGIAAARELLGAERIRIDAESYARGFYERVGFEQIGGEFLEDNIPHVGMLLECK